MIKNKERGLSGITILILVLIVAVIIILTIIFLPKGKPKTQSPNIPSYSPSPSQNTASFTPVNLTQNQMTKIGTTTQNQIQQLQGIEGQKPLPDGSLEYDIKSSIDNRPNVVLVKDGMAIYEKDLLLDASSNSPLKMSDVTSKYGQPEEIVNGSNFYGYGVSTYIYADKGFAVIGNANADKVYELQTFLPMSIDQYKSQYGQDLNSNYSQPDKEGISADQENLLNFKSHLPYAGNSFIIVYNKDTDITTVVIKQNNKDVGTKNFQSYLETFGITDSSQINNLTIEYK